MTLVPMWFKGLTPELQRKAELDFGETPTVKERCLGELRSLINDQDNIHCRQDDLFLLRFLRSKKYDVQKSFQVLRNYFRMLEKHKGAFTRKLPSQMKHVFEMNYTCFAPYRLTPGSHVYTIRIGSFDLEKAAAEDVIATSMIMGELAMECEATQICGATCILDGKGMRFEHYRRILTIPFVSLVISLLQDSWPIRICSLHFVNEPLLVHGIFRLIKPMIGKKLREKFHFHGSDLSLLHAHVPKELLSEELGGTLGLIDNKEFIDYLLSQEAFMEKANKYGVIEKASK